MPTATDHLPPIPAEALRLIHRVRDARFANGRVCPHCGCRRVVLWGGFRCRTRYRCRGCNRTFSDLTGTPYSYSKKPELWAAYQNGMRQCVKLRQAAADVGIHLATSFRWRHALLGRLPAGHSDTMTGWTEFIQLSIAYSDKGRRMGRMGRRRGSGSGAAEWQRSDHVHLLIGQSRVGHTWSQIMAVGVLHSRLIAAALAAHQQATILLPATQSPAWRWALREVSHISVGLRNNGFEHHLTNAAALRNRLIVWLEQFKGVATKYLPHYLAWHRLVDVEIPGIWSQRVTLQCSGGTPFS